MLALLTAGLNLVQALQTMWRCSVSLTGLIIPGAALRCCASTGRRVPAAAVATLMSVFMDKCGSYGVRKHIIRSIRDTDTDGPR